MMRTLRLLVAAVLLLIPSAALAQSSSCNGQLQPGYTCGNPGGSQAPVKAAPLTQFLDQNFSSTRGVLLERGASGWQAITPGTSGLPYVSNGPGADPSYQAVGTGALPFPVGPAGGLNLYASPSGSDTGNKCTSSGTPCTLKGACNIRSQFAVFLSGAVNINLADGTYSSTDANSALCTQNGNGGNGPILTSLIGNSVTPANVILAVPANSIGVLIQDLAEVAVSYLTITGGNGSTGLSAGQFTVLDLATVHFGAFGTNSVHVGMDGQASYNILGGGEFIDGSASFHWQMRTNAVLHGAGGTTITTNVTFTDFLDTRGPVDVNLIGWTLTNSSTVTGQAASLVGPGYLLTTGNAACSSVLPGTSGCVLSNGFQDSFGDPSTFSGVAIPTQIRIRLTAPTTYYANASTGNDSNSCTIGLPCQTAQRLINLQNTIDNAGFAVTLQLVTGSPANFPAGVVCNTPFVGGGTVTLTGDPTTPTNVVLNSGAAGVGALVTNGCIITITNMQVKGSGDLIMANNGGQGYVSGIDFTQTSGFHLAARAQGQIFKTGAVTISGGAQSHELFRNNAVLQDSGNTTSFTNSVTFTVGFVSANYDASAAIQGNNYVLNGHTVTGPSYDISGSSVLFTNGTCNALPGSSAGVTSFNGQCF